MSENTGLAKVAEKKDKPTSEPSFNMDELQALAALVNEHGFTDFEFENENIRVRLSKQISVPMMAAAPTQTSAPAVQAAPAASTDTPSEAGDPDAGLHKIVSPIVGTFYRASGPDKEPYVKEGSNVSAESTVCIVEAMKLMNEIQADVSGEIVKIYVDNGQPVEYGQPLFGVRK
ncbi:MAG: acetyl-CoA carboxylase biotin carboxyl carrier protein [Pyrinomonadaceae bacterium]